MDIKVINIYKLDWKKGKIGWGEDWVYIDFSGRYLGVWVEELMFGFSFSEYYYYMYEEEYILVMEGEVIFLRGNDEYIFRLGDYVWFVVGDRMFYYLENWFVEKLKYFVFGERKDSDVVIYLKQQVVLIKSFGNKLF